MTNLPLQVQRKYYKCDFCHFGTPWRRQTRFLKSGRLSGLRHLCDRSHKHRVLRGRGTQRSFAACLRGLPSQTSILRRNQCPYCCERRRVREAQNPGPRLPRRGRRSPGLLDAAQLVRPESWVMPWLKVFGPVQL